MQSLLNQIKINMLGIWLHLHAMREHCQFHLRTENIRLISPKNGETATLYQIQKQTNISILLAFWFNYCFINFNQWNEMKRIRLELYIKWKTVGYYSSFCSASQKTNKKPLNLVQYFISSEIIIDQANVWMCLCIVFSLHSATTEGKAKLYDEHWPAPINFKSHNSIFLK